eukprot:scpid75176/ scgid12780/ Heparan-sulfate 6-O-sulfotransferase 1-B
MASKRQAAVLVLVLTCICLVSWHSYRTGADYGGLAHPALSATYSFGDRRLLTHPAAAAATASRNTASGDASLQLGITDHGARQGGDRGQDSDGSVRDMKEAVHVPSVLLAKQLGFNFPVVPRLAALPAYPPPEHVKHNALRLVSYRGREFNISNEKHVLAMIHIQKTAGTTLNRLLAERLMGDFSCWCRPVQNANKEVKLDMNGRVRKDWKHCKCYRPSSSSSQWLFSRTTTGWKCGLHPTYTALTECLASGKVDMMERKKQANRAFFVVTILRRPIDRFLSEFAHVKRGVTWKNSTFQCNGVKLSHVHMPLCFPGRDWSHASMDEFLACPHNMAFNRQTRMLANLSVVNCYDSSSMPTAEYNERLLHSAQQTLLSLAWFGLTEYMSESLEMFESRFGVQFAKEQLDYKSGDGKPDSKSSFIWKNLTESLTKRIVQANILDLQLYDFAEKLFLDRYKELKQQQQQQQ